MRHFNHNPALRVVAALPATMSVGGFALCFPAGLRYVPPCRASRLGFRILGARKSSHSSECWHAHGRDCPEGRELRL
jgi:hypothetical protein